ncbi:hypothetical protein LCGC14_0357800 [marine sediment metagenome]|uniref:Uncharacterized protein n=1 Tax=marine sediment metagenome TaxID=412755 RepID=A0A0F9T8U7_9ZZZZ
MSQVKKWAVTGFATLAESKKLADKVITMLSEYEGRPDEMGTLKRYLDQEHRYTVAQGREIDSMWQIFTKPKKARRKK